MPRFTLCRTVKTGLNCLLQLPLDRTAPVNLRCIESAHVGDRAVHVACVMPYQKFNNNNNNM